MQSLKWGVLSTANIGTKLVIPGMQRSQKNKIVAISSRNLDKAKEAAGALEISKAYGSYEELLADPEIDAVYNPLPNHLHVPWTIKALEAGKHVLCEKPISITDTEAEELLEAAKKYPDLKVMEAFMYRFHPQWKKVKSLIADGEIGELKSIRSVFTYFNTDPKNVRNMADIGGGGLLDIGCYCINLSRFIFEGEPKNIQSFMEFDPEFGTDRLASGILEFENGTATFTCSTQLENYQEAIIHGSKGMIKLNIPFNAPNEHTRKAIVKKDGNTETHFFDTCDQYTLQADAFAEAIFANTPVPVSLEDSIANMKVITTMFNQHPQK